jgi:hypothetical protein
MPAVAPEMSRICHHKVALPDIGLQLVVSKTGDPGRNRRFL